MNKAYIILFCIFLSKTSFVFGVPPPLTQEEKQQMAYWSKLYSAVQAGDIEGIRKQWDICHEKNIDIAGAILSASDVKTVKLLEKLGADVDGPQPAMPFNKIPLRQNILQAACMDGHVEVVRYLLAREKADVRIQDIYGRTLLSLSVAEGWTRKTQRPEIVRMLIDKGVDLDAADDAGMTPLMGMVCVADMESFKMLLDAGAAINIKDKEGKTVDDYIDALRKDEENGKIAEQIHEFLKRKKADNPQSGGAKMLIDNKPKSLSLCADDNSQKCTVLNN